MQTDWKKIFSHFNKTTNCDLWTIYFMPIYVHLINTNAKVFRYIEKINIECPIQLCILFIRIFEIFIYWKYHLWTWRFENVFKAAHLVSNLKPHCVSLMPLTHRNQTRKWKPYIRIVRNKVRLKNILKAIKIKNL